jgi:hypothetical protein
MMSVLLMLSLGVQTSSPDPTDPPGSVSRSQFTRAVFDREPVDDVVSPVEDGAAILFFSELRDLTGQTVHHVWRCQDGRTVRIRFAVRGPRWRVWSRRHALGCGSWQVSVERRKASLAVATMTIVTTVSLDVYRDLLYVPEGFPMGLASGQSQGGGLAPRPFERLIAEPTYATTTVLYGYLPLGDGRLSFAVDGGAAAPQVWFDRNDDEDLSNDGPPMLNEGTGLFAARVTVALPPTRTRPEDRRPARRYDVWVWLSGPTTTDRPVALSALRPRFYAVGHYAGRLRVGADVFDVVAFERRNYDATFEDGDVCVDLDRDERCAEPDEIVHDGQRLSIGGRPYRWSVKLR